MKTKAITTIIVTLFLASMLSMAFVTPAKAQYLADAYTVGLWHLNKEFGTALNFDNVDDYVAVSYSSSLDFTAAGQDFSFEAWINSAVEDYDYIFQQLWDGTGRTWLYLTPDGAVSSYIGGADTMTATGVITSGKWHHVALTFDKGIGSQVGTLKIYVDGEMKASSTRTFDAVAQVGYRIGIDGTQWPFNGKIDEVRISNVVRTSFDLSKPLTVDGNTVALWHFDEGSGQSAYDATGNGNNGQLGSTSGADVNDPIWVDSTIPIAIDSSGYNNHGTIYGANWVDGKFGKALEFDGVDDYVEVPDSISLRPSVFTIESWIKPHTQPRWSRVLEKFWDGGTGVREAPYLSYALVLGEDPVVGSISFLIGDGTNLYKVTSVANAIPNNAWTHVAATYDGSQMRLYINGVEDANSPLSVTTTVAYSADLLYIGARIDPQYPVYFDGVIDEVRISNVARTSFEWIPPIINEDFVLQDGTTLPVKFRVWSQGLPVTLTITGAGLPDAGVTYAIGDPTYTLRYDATEDYYIANFHTKDFPLVEGTTYEATVYIDATAMGSIFFDLYAAGKGAYRGNSGK